MCGRSALATLQIYTRHFQLCLPYFCLFIYTSTRYLFHHWVACKCLLLYQMPSNVWNYYSKTVNVAGVRFAQCNNCPKFYNRAKSNTTALWRHLETIHPALYAEAKETTKVCKKLTISCCFKWKSNFETFRNVCKRLKRQKDLILRRTRVIQRN